MKNQYKSLVSGTIALVICLVAYFGVFNQWISLSESRTQFDIVKEENDRLIKAQNDITAFLNDYANNKTNVDVANLTLPLKDPDVPILLGNLATLVAESGMSLTTINVIPEVATTEPVPNSIKRVDVDVSVIGTYETFQNFLLRLERNMRLMDVMTINIIGDDPANLEYSLRLATYYQSQ